MSDLWAEGGDAPLNPHDPDKLTADDYRWAAYAVEEYALREDDSDLRYIARKLFAKHLRLSEAEA